MEDIYLNLLDRNTRSLTQEIELNISSEIKIKVDASRAGKLACEIDQYGGTILIPEPGYFPNESVYHELLHIRRLCVFKVPRIQVCEAYDGWTPELANGLTSLDNDIEHFIIVPDELNMYPNRETYWISEVEYLFNNYDQLGLIQDDQERRVLINWAFAQHVFLSNDLAEKANFALTKIGVNDRASKFLSEILESLDEKEILVQTFFKNLRIPFDVGCLEYLDCINNTRYEKTIGGA
jgi:hypothetical protein